jgi:hypothetical protein
MSPTLRLKNSFRLTVNRSPWPVQSTVTSAPSGTALSIQSRGVARMPWKSAPADACFNPCDPAQIGLKTTT